MIARPTLTPLPRPRAPRPRCARLRGARPRVGDTAARLALLATLLALAVAGPALAMTSHAGWPADEHLVMDRGPAGQQHVLIGVNGKHNYLLGGYGDDTIYGGDSGDVIWGDYHPSGWPARQTAIIHAGDGPNIIYANDTFNYVWTGANPATVVHVHENSGVVHCQNPRQIVYTSHHALPHYKLHGCKRISFYSVGY